MRTIPRHAGDRATPNPTDGLAGKNVDPVIPAKFTHDLKAKWGNVMLNGDTFTRNVYEGIKRRQRA